VKNSSRTIDVQGVSWWRTIGQQPQSKQEHDMISRIELQPGGSFARWLHTASLRQRLLTLATLIVALLLSGALLYFQPGSHTFPPAQTTAPAPGAKPALPPGFDTYYYWGQHQPISQQP
jgi:hypothetical protein